MWNHRRSYLKLMTSVHLCPGLTTTSESFPSGHCFTIELVNESETVSFLRPATATLGGQTFRLTMILGEVPLQGAGLYTF